MIRNQVLQPPAMSAVSLRRGAPGSFAGIGVAEGAKTAKRLSQIDVMQASYCNTSQEGN
jgi:hypothetical protein